MKSEFLAIKEKWFASPLSLFTVKEKTKTLMCLFLSKIFLNIQKMRNYFLILFCWVGAFLLFMINRNVCVILHSIDNCYITKVSLSSIYNLIYILTSLFNKQTYYR